MNGFVIDFPGHPVRSCRVRFGRGLLRVAAGWIVESGLGRRIAVIADKTVAALYAGALIELLEASDLETALLTFLPGEKNKSWKTLGRLLEGMTEARVGRDGAVVALGGGVTGDLAGAAAALYARGIPWVQLPTTTLSMADSAIGGKTGVNVTGVKNAAGALHQPSAVFGDLDTLKTLPERHFRAGLAEVVKTALIGDAGLFADIEGSPASLLEAASPFLETALEKSAVLKAGIVSRDEREEGERAILNAGHTIGHAVEAASGGDLLHGEAVAIGLALEGRLAREAAGFPEQDEERLLGVLRALGLPTKIPRRTDRRAVLSLLSADKKSRAGEVRFALPRAIGRAGSVSEGWTVAVGTGQIEELLADRDQRS